ncbi:MAG TPA: hypothetical protein VKT52_02205 [Ktedonobacterales bacterium]|nr:hypothetical protein [Ktedonobacterales bacterium]
MAESGSGDEAREPPASDQPPMPPPIFPAPTYPLFPPISPIPLAQEPSALERWRVPLIVALVAVFVIFGVLDISSVFLRPAQNAGATRPLIVNAQIVNDPTPAAHPDLGLAPGALAVTCGKTSRITITNQSARPLQWTVTTGGDALTFSANTPRSSLLAPGQSITLTVMAFSQPGAYLLHFTDDHGESADVTVQVSC